MKYTVNPYIIGAGGVASYLLPVLLKAFQVDHLAIIDADVLEERNLDRQMFNPKLIGQYKAQALVKTVIRGRTPRVQVINEWFDGQAVPPIYNWIICVADNHPARRAAIQAGYFSHVPCIVAGNEYYDSEAFLSLPENIHHDKIDPQIRNKEIATGNQGSPIRCTGEAQEATPQLAIANCRCATQILDLIFNYEESREKDFKDFRSRPVEITTSRWQRSSSSIGEW